MVFNLILSSPYPWFFVASLFLGGFLSCLTRRPSQSRNPERAKERKRFWTALSLCLFLLLLLGGIFIPGPEKAADIYLYIFLLSGSAVFFLAFRFRKAFGLPLFGLICLLGGVWLLFLQTITAFTGETEIARLKITSCKDNLIKFDFIDQQGVVTSLEMPGCYLGVEVKELIFHDLFVFLGAKTAYRLVGIKSAGKVSGSELTQELRGFELPRPQGIAEGIYQFITNHLEYFPFIKTAQIQITYIQALSGATYSVRIQHDSGVEIMRAWVVTQ